MITGDFIPNRYQGDARPRRIRRRCSRGALCLGGVRGPHGPRSLVAMAAAIAIVPSAVTAQDAPKRLLFLTHAGLYKHASLGPAEAAVTSWGPGTTASR